METIGRGKDMRVLGINEMMQRIVPRTDLEKEKPDAMPSYVLCGDFGGSVPDDLCAGLGDGGEGRRFDKWDCWDIGLAITLAVVGCLVVGSVVMMFVD